MKKKLKKTISIILTVIMLTSVMSAFALAAETEKNDIPVIFVDGIASTDIINTQTGKSVFPPSAQSIISGVSDAIFPLISSLFSGDYSKLSTPVNKAVNTIFKNAACDKNGKPVNPTDTEYVRPTEEIRDCCTENLGYTATNAIYYSYDWRLDMRTQASNLRDFIEYVLETTGSEKVNLIGFSMGTCVLATYLHDYDYANINSVIYLAGGYNGVSTCGEPFSGNVGFSSEAMVRFVNTMLGQDFGSYILKAVIDALYQGGVIDNVISVAEDITDEILMSTYEGALRDSFGTMAGMWSLIPYDMYDASKALIIGDNVSDSYLEDIDYYHYEIQGHNEEIIQGALDRGINFAIIAKYGSTVPPCIESINNIGDSVIDTKFESFGATCSTADTTLGESYVQAVNDGHNHLSADGLIDASTCCFPEYTWFTKGLNHSDHNNAEWTLCDFILNSEEQPTVWDNSDYPQFLIYKGENKENFVPLTSETDESKFGDVTPVQTSIFQKIIHVFQLIVKAFKALFSNFNH